MTNRPATEATDDLIRRLAASPPPARLSAGFATAVLLAAMVVTVALFLMIFGPRANLGQLMGQPEVLAKSLLPLALSVPALALALRASRPGLPLHLGVLAIPAIAALALFTARLVQTPSSQVIPGIMGNTAIGCMVIITLLSLPTLITGIFVFRRGASVRPALTGALIGLAGSAGIAAGYALHCVEDLPLFFTIWYGLAMLIASTLGALAGKRYLSWQAACPGVGSPCHLPGRGFGQRRKTELQIHAGLWRKPSQW